MLSLWCFINGYKASHSLGFAEAKSTTVRCPPQQCLGFLTPKKPRRATKSLGAPQKAEVRCEKMRPV